MQNQELKFEISNEWGWNNDATLLIIYFNIWFNSFLIRLPRESLQFCLDESHVRLSEYLWTYFEGRSD